MTTVQVPERPVDLISAETSWISACPGGLWEVRRRWLGERQRGDCTPMMGSLCKVKVRRKSITEQNTLQSNSLYQLNEPESTVSVDSSEQATSFPRSQDSVLQVPLDEWFMLHMGEGQCDIVEGCLDGMRAGEMCEFTLSAWTARDSNAACSDSNSTQIENKTGQGLPQQSLCFTLQLHSLTPGQESWQMTPEEKWAWVQSYKQMGGQRFGKGDIWGAADCYCRAVKLAISLHAQTRGKTEESEEGMDGDNDTSLATSSDEKKEEENVGDSYIPTEEDYKTVKAELHSNLSLCQLKLGLLVKSRDSSIKATELNPKSTKAWYRLGQACLQLGELEESRMAFGKILEIQPDSASARAALKQVNSKLKDINSKLGQRLSKMFN